jgi:predicted TIM-barrel fold metal-dependent hydrolase
MNRIPIFDSLTHPTLDGHWILPRYANRSNIDDLLKNMQLNNVQWAFAVGMSGIGSYEESSFVKLIKEKADKKLFPVAFLDISNISNSYDLDVLLSNIKSLGYSGIKLHPRIGKFNLTHPLLPLTIDKANEFGLTVFLCTYFYDNKKDSCLNNINTLIQLLTTIGTKSKIILLHSGCVLLLEYIEIARAFSNVLLDLSFTLCNYQGSSIDLDLQYVFENFDRRICVGSDHPQFSLENFRKRFEHFSSKIELEKAENIAYKNINSFIANAINE